jgi:16S rRNA G527 N7-methylase RsmG
MTYDRKKHLSQIHSQRKKNTVDKVDKAIQNLIKFNKNINFNSVSTESGISMLMLL